MKIETAVSVAEYFARLEASDIKLEYIDGDVVAMAGAQPNHVLIQSNLLYSMMACLRAKGCAVFGSDLQIKVSGCDSYFFPDLVIVCAKPEYEPTDTGLLALTNPEIVVEVLSPSTEFLDRVKKMDCYKTLPSLKEYVLVSSTKKQVEVIRKISANEWLHHTYSQQDETVLVNDFELLFEEIYQKVEMEA
jgi:Uma2 family endonuclease